MRKIVIWLISLYQRTLSPDTGWPRVFYPAGYCKFTPTCSEYTKQAVSKYGVIVGLGKGFWRVLRCNPWSRGGFDPVDQTSCKLSVSAKAPVSPKASQGGPSLDGKVHQVKS